MFVNDNSSIFRDISTYFTCSFFIDKTSKTSDVDIFTAGHGAFDHVKKSFNGSVHVCLINTCFVSNLLNYFCFCHVPKRFKWMNGITNKFYQAVKLMLLPKLGNKRNKI